MASNEQLVFKSELEGRTNNMNTNELREEMQAKINPAVYRQLFAYMGPQHNEDRMGGKLFTQMIPEEDKESGSSSDEEDKMNYEMNPEMSEEEDDLSKGNSRKESSSYVEEEEDEGNVEDEEDMGDGDEIPEDLEVGA